MAAPSESAGEPEGASRRPGQPWPYASVLGLGAYWQWQCGFSAVPDPGAVRWGGEEAATKSYLSPGLEPTWPRQTGSPGCHS